MNEKEHRIQAIYRRKSRMRAEGDVNKSCGGSGRALFIGNKTKMKALKLINVNLTCGREINEMCTIV